MSNLQENAFEAIGLETKLVQAVTDLGFEQPTPIQEKVLPVLLKEDTDLVALAQTGSGKTAAFGLPLLTRIDSDSKDLQGLILCPTRELCVQITKDLETYSKYLKKTHIVAVYGGASIRNQVRAIKRGAQIIVATPGRMLDLVRQKEIRPETVEYVVLDEADEMLNMGFKEELDAILSHTPEDKNTWLFSATMPKEVARIAKHYLNNPIEITVGSKNQANANIEHFYCAVRPKDFYPALKRIIDYHSNLYGIVFCRTRRDTREIAERLVEDGYTADSLHGDLSQSQRDLVMRSFRQKHVKLLVATDVAARGLDIDNITHIIHYDIPESLESYTHRSGRTARAGKSGTSIIITGSTGSRRIKTIERIIGTKITKMTLPSAEEVQKKQLFRIAKRLQEAPDMEERYPEVLSQIHEQLSYLSKEELINHFFAMEFNHLPKVGHHAIEELNGKNSGGRKRDDRDNKLSLFLNLGKYDGLDRQTLLSFLSKNTGIKKQEFYITELKNSFSRFRIDGSYYKTVKEQLDGITLGDRKVYIDRSKGNGKRNKWKKRKYSKR